MERDFQAELKAAQASVKTLGAKREKLVGDVREENVRVQTAVEQLKALGIENAEKLSVEELKALRDKSQADLETNLDTLQKQIKAAEGVLTEYEAVQV